ncbi:hypothetical protein [Mycolicibacterium sp. S3B2]|uniref:hypothetical protein n=1 Tax=Mycolicibacterium sp. S3B2 TaxID=3415120 RepID=UPI003C79BEA2
MTATATLEIPAASVTDYSGETTVQQALDEGSRTDHLLRAAEAGFGDWPIAEFNDVAWQLCHDLWAGGDFDKVVDELSMHRSRIDVLRVYDTQAGHTCNIPPGAPVPPGR